MASPKMCQRWRQGSQGRSSCSTTLARTCLMHRCSISPSRSLQLGVETGWQAAPQGLTAEAVHCASWPVVHVLGAKPASEVTHTKRPKQTCTAISLLACAAAALCCLRFSYTLSRYFNDFERQLLAPGLGNFSQYAAPEALVDWFLANELIKSANDGYRGSVYFWKDSASAGVCVCV